MDPHVLREVGAVGEGLAAVTALVRLGFPHVHLGVQLEICLGAKSLKKQYNLENIISEFRLISHFYDGY